MQTTCDTASCPPAGTLAAYAGGGGLSDEECLAIEAHLSTCSDCCHVVERAPSGPIAERLRQATLDAGASPPARWRMAGAYEVLEEIGRGGCGIVYKARQPGTGRIVALKRLRAGALAGRSELLRFRREAQALARLIHPHIVQVFDVGEQDAEPYLAMEYISGEPLSRRLRQGLLPPEAAARLVEQLAHAVAAAHACGIVHRDLKPANVLLALSDGADPSLGCPKIVDFGLAKGAALDAGETCTGTLIGTPAYMAPEQVDGPADTVGPAADVYGLGAILYECLTGRPPFSGATYLETLDLVRRQEPAPPRRERPLILRTLESVCLKCLEKDPRRRYATAQALARDLRCVLENEPVSARPPGPAARTWRWARRHRVASTLLTCAAVGVVSGVFGLAAHQRRLQTEIDRANTRTTEAVAQRKLAEELYTEGFHAFNSINSEIMLRPQFNSPEYSSLVDVTSRESINYLESLVRLTNQPKVAYDLAQAYQVAAMVTLQRGETAAGVARFRSAEQALQSLVDRFPTEEFYVSERARIRARLSATLSASPADLAEAVRLIDPACADLERLFREHPDPATRGGDLAWAQGIRYLVAMNGGNFPAAADALRREVEIRRLMFDQSPDNEGFRLELEGDLKLLRDLETQLVAPASIATPMTQRTQAADN
jgi:serine/threonine protein kinase